MSIQEKINNINEVLKTNDQELIMSTISDIDPIILLYYQMNNKSFKYYINKLPENYFVVDCKKATQKFIEINDAYFFNYAFKFLRFRGGKIIKRIISHYIENNDIDSLNILKELNPYGLTDSIINYCYQYNKHEILKQYLMNPENNDIDEAEPDNFNHTLCGPIMATDDLIDIIKVLHEYSKQFPDFINFDFNLVFNAAIINGREKCMHYALNNSVINYHYEIEDAYVNKSGPYYEEVIGAYPFTDSIMYAIIGKNINCIQLVFDIFKNQIKDENWEHYFKFAAIYGTLEIIKYMITIKPYLVEQIDGFYTNILKFALCEAKLDIVQFAINNGAQFSVSFHEFVKKYNVGRCPGEYDVPLDGDFNDFYLNKYSMTENFDKEYEECIKYINDNN
jgi:hypothetical protein